MLLYKPAIPVPKLPFIGLRVLQALLTIIVLGVLGHFQHHLWRNDYPTPWEFALLDTASAITLLNTTLTLVLLFTSGLSALPILIIDTLLFTFWLISTSLLLRAMGGTTTQSCSATNWGSSAGIRVCHLFKALIAFSLTATFSFFSSAIYAGGLRKKARRHRYQAAVNPANKSQPPSATVQQGTAYHGAGGRGVRDSVGTMEGLLAPENRQSGMSAFSSDTRGKHLSQSTMGSPIIGVQPASPVLGNGGFKETGGGGYGQVPQS